jgi:hypothetical protein
METIIDKLAGGSVAMAGVQQESPLGLKALLHSVQAH